ncbi:hypothetical protein GCM10023088_15940 [Actinomadura verrucosospora]
MHLDAGAEIEVDDRRQPFLVEGGDALALDGHQRPRRLRQDVRIREVQAPDGPVRQMRFQARGDRFGISPKEDRIKCGE